ncbi:hypothetical protein EVAR_80684_1 [Eumeta japonica]|uniref:Uncharacterized protein n=1 Tax=Eumeta variegata TaxID=151549 RepID=A0A4C1U3B0_EUMVA|nr:hypothetical protein EVAR_80684_1 [Eumeta japonica]
MPNGWPHTAYFHVNRVTMIDVSSIIYLLDITRVNVPHGETKTGSCNKSSIKPHKVMQAAIGLVRRSVAAPLMRLVPADRCCRSVFRQTDMHLTSVAVGVWFDSRRRSTSTLAEAALSLSRRRRPGRRSSPAHRSLESLPPLLPRLWTNFSLISDAPFRSSGGGGSVVDHPLPSYRGGVGFDSSGGRILELEPNHTVRRRARQAVVPGRGHRFEDSAVNDRCRTRAVRYKKS